jgi:hypothetical protein
LRGNIGAIRLIDEESDDERWDPCPEKSKREGWTGANGLIIQPASDEQVSPSLDAQVAQLVEHATENRSVGGSIPPLGTTRPLQV